MHDNNAGNYQNGESKYDKGASKFILTDPINLRRRVYLRPDGRQHWQQIYDRGERRQ
jgi:hypothetical protein